MTINNQQLNDHQLKDVEQLAAQCQASDNGLPTIYYHLLRQKRDNDSNVLYYENNQLLGFLSVYFFYTDACEVSLIIHPEHRRHGIASKLLANIIPLLHAKKISRLIFSSTSVSPESQPKGIMADGFVYEQSEFHMVRNSFEPVIIGSPVLSIREAEATDLENLCTIDAACFPNQQTSMHERFNYLLDDRNYTILIAFHKDKAVGKAHLRWQAGCCLFSDIAILPKFQGKGLGSELLAFCINHSLSAGESKIILDVETNHLNALNLYLRQGFKTTTLYNFWSISLAKLEKSLQSYSI